MEQELTFIQYQLWGVMVLLLAFVGSNAVCYILHRSDRDERSPEFGSLWDRGEIEELLSESEKFIKKYPNHSSALYFRAKALISKKRYVEAKELLNTLKRNHPELKLEISELSEVIENANS